MEFRAEQQRRCPETTCRARSRRIADLRAEAEAPIRLPPPELLAERVFQLRALAESSDVQSARAARADFLPLVLRTEMQQCPPSFRREGVVVHE